MTDEQDYYDEFGNYNGPVLASSDEEDESETGAIGHHGIKGGDEHESVFSDFVSTEQGGTSTAAEESSTSGMIIDTNQNEGERQKQQQLVVSTSSKHSGDEIVSFPSPEEIYGSNVKSVVLDEDAMMLEEPLVEPIKTTVVSLLKDESSSRRKEDLDQEQAESGARPTTATKVDMSNGMLTSDEFLIQHLLSNETTQTRRGIVLAGHLHCGKTTFIDMLLEQQMIHNYPDALGSKASLPPPITPQPDSKNSKSKAEPHGGPRFTDTLCSEQSRQLSMKMTPITLAMPSLKHQRHYALTIMDCPGHPQFHDETVASMRLADGVCLMVDAVEGADVLHVDMAISCAISEGLPITLCINKMDRLIVELKIPPNDAYFKLVNIIEGVNAQIQSKLPPGCSKKLYPPLSPERNNVCFASSQHGWCTTLYQMAQLYADCNTPYGMPSGGIEIGKNITVEAFAKRLWGDCYLDPVRRTFHRSPRDLSPSDIPIRRTFVQFVLEPLYKLYVLCLGGDGHEVDRALSAVGVHLSKKQSYSSARPLLRDACKRFFGPSSSGFVDMITEHIPCPKRAAKGKVARCYTDSISSRLSQHMIRCSSTATSGTSGSVSSVPLMIHVTKMMPSSSDGGSFAAFGRIYSGTLTKLEQVKILGESYSPDDKEDMSTATVSSMFVLQGRRKIPLTSVTAGNWVLIEGVDATISKTATITNVSSNNIFRANDDDDDDDDDDDTQIFRPLSFPFAGHESVFKLAIEPLNPSELPKMVEGLRSVSKLYPMLQTKVEESGEHVLFGTGELYLDSIMHDIRHNSSTGEIEVKVADPTVSFRESIADRSKIQCAAITPNKQNKLTFVAEALDEDITQRLESSRKPDLVNWNEKDLSHFFQTQYKWDLLSSRSVWAFGSSSASPLSSSSSTQTCVLIDDVLPSEVNKSTLYQCKSSIVQGFQWAVREGPLCEEPVRSAKIQLFDATLADQPVHRGGGQLIPTTRRAVHASLLMATPKLMEPIYELQIQCADELINAIQPLVSRRRGHIVQDVPISGTPLSLVKAYMPVIDSFGFETDLRVLSKGQAMVLGTLHHWNVVPGNPLDTSIVLHPLEPSPTSHLAREFVLKTRRRKGLLDDIVVKRYIDEDAL